ncbi:MAG: chemotaxis protein CheA [Nitrospirae bacterium]|nr:chemotaxis protein CheA [Nitrospirota bacterium]
MAAEVAPPPPKAPAPEAALGLALDPSLETSLVDEFVTEATEHLDSIESNLLALEEHPGDTEVINTIFRPFHTIKGVSGFLQLTPINRLAHETENLLDAARSGKLAVSPALVDVVLASVDLISQMVAAVRDLNGKGGGNGPVFAIEPLVARIRRVLAGEETQAPAAPARPEAGPNTAEAAETTQPAQPAREGAHARTTTIKVDTAKLDSLLNMVGELVVAQLQVRQDPIIQRVADQRLQRNLAQLSRITNELQKTAMSTRMVPIRATFQKMVRVVRDLSKKSGKAVELVMNGGDTEIDRNLVEEIYEPLMHMVRNSVDHGIEPPEGRPATGKPPVATITIGAEHKGDAILITIADDGRGLNRDKIRAKAVERGLIGPDEQPAPRELYNLIFQPGFSTADKVTDVSGRGVGMDVVVKTIEKVRGRVELDSTPGKGTTVTIVLPLTLAIIDGMVVRVGPERFIIPTLGIMESFKPEPAHYATVNQRIESLKVRGKLLPLVRVADLFHIDGAVRDPWDGLAVVVESDGRRCCLMVDTLLGKQEVVIKGLGERMQGVRGVAGGAILGDGSIGLILDIGKIYRMAGIDA